MSNCRRAAIPAPSSSRRRARPSRKRDAEGKLADKAHKAYEAKQFQAAASQFGELHGTFRQSERADEYEFFRQLSELRNSMTDLGQNPSRDRLDKLEHFLKDQKDNSLL